MHKFAGFRIDSESGGMRLLIKMGRKQHFPNKWLNSIQPSLTEVRPFHAPCIQSNLSMQKIQVIRRDFLFFDYWQSGLPFGGIVKFRKPGNFLATFVGKFAKPGWRLVYRGDCRTHSFPCQAGRHTLMAVHARVMDLPHQIPKAPCFVNSSGNPEILTIGVACH